MADDLLVEEREARRTMGCHFCRRRIRPGEAHVVVAMAEDRWRYHGDCYQATGHMPPDQLGLVSPAWWHEPEVVIEAFHAAGLEPPPWVRRETGKGGAA